jgi:hypothetical protein
VRAMLPEEAAPARRAAASMRRFIAVIMALAVLGATTGARAQDAPDGQSAQDIQKTRERASCLARLRPLENTIESDGKYAVGWRDAWLLTGATLITLNVTAAFNVSERYRRTEGIVLAVSSALLMIQKPVAVTNERALAGIRGAEGLDPCLALLDARNILWANEDDWKEHTNAPAHIIAIALPILTSAIVAAGTGHWDFAGHGNEGVNALIGIALGEFQLLTWPRPSVKFGDPSPSVKVGGTSLTVTF